MKKTLIMTLTAGTLAALLMAAPFYAQETESELPETFTEVISEGIDPAEIISEAAEDSSEDEMAGTRINTSFENGVLTITIEDPRQDSNLYWASYQGDKGDASCTELLTESTMDGPAYAGSFRAIDDGTDTIRIVRTNGTYVFEYQDFNVLCEDGAIKEITGGGQAFGVYPEDLLPVIGGTWHEKELMLLYQMEADGTVLRVSIP